MYIWRSWVQFPPDVAEFSVSEIPHFCPWCKAKALPESYRAWKSHFRIKYTTGPHYSKKCQFSNYAYCNKNGTTPNSKSWTRYYILKPSRKLKIVYKVFIITCPNFFYSASFLSSQQLSSFSKEDFGVKYFRQLRAISWIQIVREKKLFQGLGLRRWWDPIYFVPSSQPHLKNV